MPPIATADIAGRVINTPTAFIEDADGNVPAGTIERINDGLAELVSKNPGRLYALATVDAFSGDAGARELTRAVPVGRRGVFLESAKKDLLLDAPQARPTLATAASLGVPVFVHPVTDPAMHKRFARYGFLGVRLARGTINSAALFALLESGTFDELPNLRVVVTTLALGRDPARRRFWRRPTAAIGRRGVDPPSRLCRYHGSSPRACPQRRGPVGRGSCPDGPTPADCSRKIRAGKVCNRR